MKIKNRQIPVRKLLCIVIGWLHCALIFAPLYALIISFVNNEIPRERVITEFLRGLLILIPVVISWLAKRYLRNAFLYILVSLAATLLTGWVFDSAFMLVPAVFICFLRFYNRMREEKVVSLLDQPSYAGLVLILIPAVVAVFEERLDSVFQTLSLIYMAIYFLLCFVHHGIERIDNYVDVNKDMHNMPSRRITRIATTVLAAMFLVIAIVTLPALFTSDIDVRYEAPEKVYSTPEPEFVAPSASGQIMDVDDLFPEKEENPILEAILKVAEYILAVVLGIGAIIAAVYAIIQLSRRFSKSFFEDRGDFVENLQEDDLEAVREKPAKSDKPRFLDRSPNATIRRKYKKAILHASGDRPSSWMTPTEAEEHAKLQGPDIEHLHALYEKARYSPDGCTKEDIAGL